MRPLLLDLFCGAGGAAMGYHRAGFDVLGVDIEPHPDYPFPIVIRDAMVVLDIMAWAGGSEFDDFDVIHASPPCPRYSSATQATGTSEDHPDLVPAVRELLQAIGKPWVIENVVGAPMPDAVMLCGYAHGLAPLARHRLFESSVFLMSPGCACDNRPKPSIFGHSGSWRIDGKNRAIPKAVARDLLGVDWMTDRDDIADAIPPAYTEFIGAQLLAHLGVSA